MSALDKIKQGKRLTAAFLYELLYGIANGDLATENNNLPQWRNASLPDYVVTGCVWAGDNYGVNYLRLSMLLRSRYITNEHPV